MKFYFGIKSFNPYTSLPVRGAWVEIESHRDIFRPDASLPVRGAWVEIPIVLQMLPKLGVAPRAGSVG